jgi:uncharacterized protein
MWLMSPSSTRDEKPVPRLAEHHVFEMLGKIILFNVQSMLFYEVTPLVRDLVGALSASPRIDPVKSLKGTYGKRDIRVAMSYLREEGLLAESSPDGPRAKPQLKRRRGMRHLELMITHGCNMACAYCYGAPEKKDREETTHLYGSGGTAMDYEVARKGVDYLFRESGAQTDLSVIFFGGEPLLELGTMERLVPYIREKEKESGKTVDLSLSTNGLLLSDRVVEFLTLNKISCQVSMDGPKDIQDKNRCLPNGAGSYDLILPGVKRLMAARPGRVPARVTVSHNAVDLVRVTEHLLALGFGSVHIEPAIGSSGATRITAEDLEQIKSQNEQLAVFLVKCVRSNRYFNYSNLVKFIRQTRVVRERQAHYCGAGRTYFALSRDGVFYPCHRFVGMEEYRMGDVDAGLDPALRERILELVVDNRPTCRECWARYLCGGGCWKHAVDSNGCLEAPENELSCEIIRHQIQCAMAINSELKVSDKDILSDLYEDATEPYLVTEKGGE